MSTPEPEGGARVGDFEVVGDEDVGAGGFLRLRRLRLVRLRPDGSRSAIGLYDYVERPVGRDAVTLALWRRRPGGSVEVLLRRAVRVPLAFGRDDDPARGLLTEAVAGIVEADEIGWAAVQARAAAEAHEEAGVVVPAAAVTELGAPLYLSPGMCAERLWFAAVEVPAGDAVTPPTDGSPFEEGATLAWLDLDEAIARCRAGEIADVKTELILRRLREAVPV